MKPQTSQSDKEKDLRRIIINIKENFELEDYFRALFNLPEKIPIQKPTDDLN